MDTHLKDLQRRLRSAMPAPEVILWNRIRGKQLGVKFRRQYTIENRILDFYVPEIRLGIEIDGESHFEKSALRARELQNDRQLFLKHQITIIRFLNSEVIRELDGVIEKIRFEIIKRKSPSVSPPSAEEGEKDI